MKVALERFDGSRLIKDMRHVAEGSAAILVPRRSALDWSIVDFMRFDKTKEMHEGLPLFRQSSAAMEVELDGDVTVNPPLCQPDDKRPVIRVDNPSNN